MAKFGAGKLYGVGWLYGPDPQYLTGAGGIPAAEAWGTPLVHPGPALISGVGNIATSEAWGTHRIFRIPQKLALGANIRRLRTTPQIRKLKVTPDG